MSALWTLMARTNAIKNRKTQSLSEQQLETRSPPWSRSPSTGVILVKVPVTRELAGVVDFGAYRPWFTRTVHICLGLLDV